MREKSAALSTRMRRVSFPAMNEFQLANQRSAVSNGLMPPSPMAG